MYKKLIAGGVAALVVGGTTATAVPTSSTGLTCTATYQTLLYDTPSGDYDASGKVEPGYYVTPSTMSATATIQALVTGYKYVALCTDGTTSYVCTLDQKTFQDNYNNATMPLKAANTYLIGGTKCE